jgi:hypothetical protein
MMSSEQCLGHFHFRFLAKKILTLMAITDERLGFAHIKLILKSSSVDIDELSGSESKQ